MATLRIIQRKRTPSKQDLTSDGLRPDVVASVHLGLSNDLHEDDEGKYD